MKDDYSRSKRTTPDHFDPVEIEVPQKAPYRNSGILQAVINILVYFLLYRFLVRDHPQYMIFFIVMSSVSIITQLILRFWHSIH